MKDQPYKTIKKNAESELIVQKSRFICRAKHVESELEAQDFLTQIQKKHWDATHNCYAYRITSAIQKASDDGEPSGTAGRPILSVLTNNELLYTLIIVTRYFGGVKLGGGGLIRAYSQAASEVISEAGIIQKCLHQQLLLTFHFTHLSKVEYELRRTSYYIEPMQYGQAVACTIWVPIEMVDKAQQQLEEWTNGQAEICKGKTAYKKGTHDI